jgi:hypothetical protein
LRTLISPDEIWVNKVVGKIVVLCALPAIHQAFNRCQQADRRRQARTPIAERIDIPIHREAFQVPLC